MLSQICSTRRMRSDLLSFRADLRSDDAIGKLYHLHLAPGRVLACGLGTTCQMVAGKRVGAGPRKAWSGRIRVGNTSGEALTSQMAWNFGNWARTCGERDSVIRRIGEWWCGLA